MQYSCVDEEHDGGKFLENSKRMENYVKCGIFSRSVLFMVKKTNFTFSIIFIQYMYHENNFSNMKIESFGTRFSHYFINCLLPCSAFSKTNNTMVIYIKFSSPWNKFSISTFFSSRTTLT